MYKLLMKALDHEKESFYDYVELYEKCSHEAHRRIYAEIAKDEVEHYKHIHDIFWEGKTVKTDMEEALYKMLTCEYSKMEQQLHHMK